MLARNRKVPSLTHFVNRFVEHKKRTAENIVKKWRQRGLHAAFTQWRNNALAAKAQRRDTASRVLKRLHSRQLWAGWKQWQGYVELHRAAEIRAKLAADIAGVKRAAAASLLKRWRANQQARAFTAWAQYASRMKEHKQQVVQRVARHMVQSQLWRSFRQWMWFVQETQTAEVRAALVDHKRKAGLRVIRRWRNQHMSTAFQTWVRFTQSRKEVSKLCASLPTHLILPFSANES